MRRYAILASSWLVAVILCLVPAVGQVLAAPVPGIDITYTSDADFDKGTLMNLNHDEVHQQLQLSTVITPFPFINIANSGRGTLVRIDVNSGTILGEYYTAPSGMGRNPSRTTVDQFGNVWVSNRDENGVSEGKNKGSIARVGLVIGGTRSNADGTANPSGQYLKPPLQYNTCIDRNQDGLIKTSRGSGNMLAWSNAGGVDSHGGVTTADDECIINYTRVVATNTRTVAIDANNDIWVGGANTAHEKISGTTGQPVAGTQFNLGCGGYGGLVDKNGVLWSARFGTGLLRFDTKTMTGACLGTGKGNYGLGVDPNTGEIWHTYLEGNKVAKLSPSGALLGTYAHGAWYAQGVVVDKSGNVWIAHSLHGNNVAHLRTSGAFVGNVDTGWGPTGVAVDANGKVWSTNYSAFTATRIDPAAGSVGQGGFKKGAIDKSVYLGANAYPYNYSDMTGYVVIGGTSPQGSWSVVQDSGVAGNTWGNVTWNKEATQPIPEGAVILVEARTSDTEAGLGSKGFTTVSGNEPFSLPGRYIEVRVTLKANSSGQKPILTDLRISVTPMRDVRVIDTISSGNIVINSASFTRQPDSITYGSDATALEWRFPSFTIGQLQDLSYTVSMKNPQPGENRLVSHKLEVLYTDLNGNPVRSEIGPQSVQVLASRYASSVSTDRSSYSAKQDALIGATISNLSLFPRTLDAKIRVEDSQGAMVQEVTALSGLQFAAGESKPFNDLTFNTGTNYAGSYRVRLLLYEGQTLVGEASAGFAIDPDLAAATRVVTDKVSYKPNEQAAITATMTNLGVNFALENVTATVSISAPDTAGNPPLYTSTKDIALLLQGASSSFKTQWGTGSNPAGIYLVTLVLRDSAGALLSTSSCNLTIESVTAPVALLNGQVTLDKQVVLSGESVAVTYGITNVGNIDLSDIALSVQTVNLAEEAVYGRIAEQVSAAMGASFTNSGRIETYGYGAKDYLVVLRASINGVEETLASSYFRVEGAPSTPALYAPAMGGDVETFTPALTVSNAADPNDDMLTYQYEVYADSSLTSLVSSVEMQPETAGVTAWTAATQLTENRTYYWRARAYDGLLYGPWMATASFRVNTVNDLPTAPVVSSPTDATAVAVLTPELTVTNSTDPDSENLTYNFKIALDAGFTQNVASETGIAAGQGTTSWTVPVSLQENGWYYWRAQADDWLSPGPWSTTATLFVNTANDPPSAPVLTAPSSGATVAALTTDVVVANSTDPDSEVLSYYFEADTVPSFDSPALISSGSVAEGESATPWPLGGLLDNTRYFVRAKASDGAAESPWSAREFFVNTANDAPTTPIIANPSDGGAVSSFTPALSVHNATDLDRDPLSYQFELYADAALGNLVAQSNSIAEGSQATAWEVPVPLTENLTYYWRARASDGSLSSNWTPAASFMVNTANDAPGAPVISSPVEGSSVTTPTPTLAVLNAVDPDSGSLAYDFEVYSGGSLVASQQGVPGDGSGTTSWTLGTPILDNTAYQWRARAYDGNSYGPWTAMAAFTVHVPKTSINATIDFDPNTLNRSSNGNWVVVYIELPAGYKVEDINIASIRMEGTIPAEKQPYAIGDNDKDGIPNLMVKFPRQSVIALLPNGASVPVHVTGKVGTTPFDGVDLIRVIP